MKTETKVARVMILPSIDGSEYDIAVIPPDTLSADEARAKVSEIMQSVIAANPDEWNFSEAEPLFDAAGFTFPELLKGPCWDD